MIKSSAEVFNHIVVIFKGLNVKSKAYSAQYFKQWISQYVTQMNKEEFVNVKREPQTETE